MMNAIGKEAGASLLEGYIAEAELGRQLDLAEVTLRKWRREGSGPPFLRIGKAIFYPIAGVSKWLAKRVQQRP